MTRLFTTTYPKVRAQRLWLVEYVCESKRGTMGLDSHITPASQALNPRGLLT